MSAEVQFTPLSEKGSELLDQLEQRTGVLPYLTISDGTRTYWLSAVDVGVMGFDAMLDRIDPTWREHLSRTE
jgi:hypothetical protein